MIKKLLILAFASFLITGCTTASKTIETVGQARHQIAKKEAETAVNSLCSANFNVVVEMFGRTDTEWRAFLTICDGTRPPLGKDVK